MNRTPALLKRLPFQSDDIRKFVDIARRLSRGLNISETKNADLAREVVAKICLYNNLHEVRASIGRVPFPPVGSITRADVQLLVAYGFQRYTGIPFPEAWQRAGRARLRGLSIDQVTVERQREERFKARGLKGDQDANTSAQCPTKNWHDDQARFFKHGAPSFDLCVRPDGRAFHWGAFTAVYDAIRSSRFERSIVDPLEQFPAGSEEAVDKFLSQSLIPQSWIPVSQHIQDGLVMLDHEVVWLFVGSGLCIGRAIRHKAHGGFLPRLFLTEEEVAEGLDFVVRGAYVQWGSSLLPFLITPLKGDEAVYTLKPGAPRPSATSDPRKEVHVPISDLDLVPNLYAGSLIRVQPGRGTKQIIWGLDGKAVKASTANNGATSTYYECTAWLSELDMPLLFPDFRPGPPVNDRDRFAFARDVPNKVFLPPKALDFQDRASSILTRKEKSACERLQESAATGEFFAVCKLELPAKGLEVMAGDLLAELSPGSASAELGKRARSVSAHIILRYPVLAHYGPLALNAAISVHCQGEPFADFYVETLPLSDVLGGLVMLQAGFKQGGAFRFFKSAPSKIAVSQWLAGVTDLDAVHDAAAGLEGYGAALKTQQERIARIEAAMKHDAERRRVAFDHGYLYVGAELPRAKPRSVMQMLGSLGD